MILWFDYLMWGIIKGPLYVQERKAHIGVSMCSADCFTYYFIRQSKQSIAVSALICLYACWLHLWRGVSVEDVLSNMIINIININNIKLMASKGLGIKTIRTLFQIALVWSRSAFIRYGIGSQTLPLFEESLKLTRVYSCRLWLKWIYWPFNVIFRVKIAEVHVFCFVFYITFLKMSFH